MHKYINKTILISKIKSNAKRCTLQSHNYKLCSSTYRGGPSLLFVINNITILYKNKIITSYVHEEQMHDMTKKQNQQIMTVTTHKTHNSS